MNPTVEHADAERWAVDLLTANAALIASPAPSIGIGVPSTWNPADGTHVQVAVDAVDMANHPAASTSTVRLTAWAVNPTTAKKAANRALGIVAGQCGTDPNSGFVVTRDDSSAAHLASVTISVSLRSQPL